MNVTQENAHPFSSLIPAYALEALDSDEAQAFAEHLEGCQECQAVLADYQIIAEGLLFALPPVRPPTSLRQRLAERVGTGRPPVIKSSRYKWSFGRLALSFAVLALVLINAALVFQLRSLQAQQSRLIREIQENQTVLAIVSLPDLRIVPISGQTGQGNLVIVPGTGRGALFLTGLPSLDQAHVYQIWTIPREGSPISVGLFQSEPDQPYIDIPINTARPIEEFAALGVTVEPEGGSSSPTTDPILLAEL